jgi:hypothetical protein
MAGRHINDHNFWAGGPSKESPMPMESKMKQEHSADGFGALGHYEDTTETIHSQQEMAKKKVHGHPHKPGTRN